MDKIKNPFSPGAGYPPPELAGRDGILEQAGVLLGRVRAKRPEKSLLLTGLRGVGKTVLLNEIERMAQDTGYRTILVEAHEGKHLAVLLAPHLRRLLFDLDRIAGAGNKVRRGIAVLKSFVGAIKITVGEIDIGLDIEPEAGAADSGDLEVDLPSLFMAVGEAAQERGVAVAILIDEIQYFSSRELSALIMAMHKMQQRQLPLVLIGAGLPILPGLAGESKSYAERLFSFPVVGPLPEPDAIKALQDPVLAAGEAFEPDALHEIFRLTKGYPYILAGVGLPGMESRCRFADRPASGTGIKRAGFQTIGRKLFPGSVRPADSTRKDVSAGHGRAWRRAIPYGRCRRQARRKNQHAWAVTRRFD